jgi:hypothetical protein
MNQNQKINEQSFNEPQLPTQLRAVLKIVTADEELRRKASPHVDVEKREINWEGIFRNDFSSGHRAALVWAKSLWRDESPARIDIFDRSFAMDENLRKVVIEALKIRWGLDH